MKRLISVMGIMFLVGGVALPAMAHGPGSGRGGQMMGSWQGGAQNCPGYGGTTGSLTKEQQTELEKLHQKYLDETSTAKSELWNKRGELNILLNTSNPDTEKAKALLERIQARGGRVRMEHEYPLAYLQASPPRSFPCVPQRARVCLSSPIPTMTLRL